MNTIDVAQISLPIPYTTGMRIVHSQCLPANNLHSPGALTWLHNFQSQYLTATSGRKAHLERPRCRRRSSRNLFTYIHRNREHKMLHWAMLPSSSLSFVYRAGIRPPRHSTDYSSALYVFAIPAVFSALRSAHFAFITLTLRTGEKSMNGKRCGRTEWMEITDKYRWIRMTFFRK